MLVPLKHDHVKEHERGLSTQYYFSYLSKTRVNNPCLTTKHVVHMDSVDCQAHLGLNQGQLTIISLHNSHK